jgi:hypothetical protein
VCVPSSENNEIYDSILEVLHKYPGSDDVILQMTIENQTVVRVRTNPALRVEHSAALVSDLKQLGCAVVSDNKLALSRSTS